MTESAATRAALLARPGEACDRLAAALREAGVALVLVGDPRSLDPAALRACAPRAVLVALEPAVEDSLERFDAVLHDPAVMVIFDEADLAARREGWDAARWGRHLRAKLNGHDDVLPPGAGAAWMAVSGARTDVADSDGDGVDAAVVEMMATIDEPLRDAGEDTAVRLDGSALELEWTADGATSSDAVGASGGVVLVGAGELLDSLAEPGTVRRDDAPALAVDSTPLDLEWSADRDADSADDSIAIGELSLVDAGELLDSLGDPGAAVTPPDAQALDPDVQAMLDSVSDDDHDAPAPFDAQALDADVQAMLDSAPDSDDTRPLARGAPVADRAAPPVFDLDRMSLDAMSDPDDAAREDGARATTGDGASDAAPPAAKAAPDFSRFDIGLSLADADAAPMETAIPDPAAPGASTAVDLDALDRRASALSLVETPTDRVPGDAGSEQPQGAVLVDAGLGGPDAVRQLLGGLPAGFPRPVLVRMTLDGGRYDRLVKQMQRASALRVAIADAGAALIAGTVYFLPDGMGLVRRGDGFAFAPQADTDGPWIDSLPAADSALLLLSGSDAQRVDGAMRMATEGALVAGQSPQDCYDSRASSALIAQGAASGTPAELAARLVARWPA